jgi:hypothetical protein
MKKFLAVFIFGLTVSIFADASIFTGLWCVEQEDMKIEFSGKDSVVFFFFGDENVSGSGHYSFNDSLLIAELNNSGMRLKVTYRYRKTDKGVEVTTKSMEVNGDPINANTEPIFLQRCKR